MTKSCLAVMAAIALCLGAACTSSEIPKLSGSVVDASNGEPLSGVTVTVAGRKTETDLQGEFTLTNISRDASVTASICSHEEATEAIPTNEESGIRLELDPHTYKGRVTSNLTGKGIKAISRGSVRSKTKLNGRFVVRGACPDASLRIEASGYEKTKRDCPRFG